LNGGVPYLAGRLCRNGPDGLRDGAIAVVVGAVLYVPVCWLEIRLSPQVHYWLYGFTPSHFFMTVRYEGYRPMGCTTHGLVLGLWMCMGAMLAAWLSHAGALEGLRRRLDLTPRALAGVVVLLAVTAVAVKSTGAILLGLAGLAVLLLVSRQRVPLVLTLLLVAAPAYMAVRTAGLWSGQDAVAWIARNIDRDRAESLDFRLRNEDELIAK